MNENSEYNEALEVVTRSLRGVLEISEKLADTAGNHNRAIEGLSAVTGKHDGNIRELQAKVYALEQENETLRGKQAELDEKFHAMGLMLMNLSENITRHTHSSLTGPA